MMSDTKRYRQTHPERETTRGKIEREENRERDRERSGEDDKYKARYRQIQRERERLIWVDFQLCKRFKRFYI